MPARCRVRKRVLGTRSVVNIPWCGHSLDEKRLRQHGTAPTFLTHGPRHVRAVSLVSSLFLTPHGCHEMVSLASLLARH